MFDVYRRKLKDRTALMAPFHFLLSIGVKAFGLARKASTRECLSKKCDSHMALNLTQVIWCICGKPMEWQGPARVPRAEP